MVTGALPNRFAEGESPLADNLTIEQFNNFLSVMKLKNLPIILGFAVLLLTLPAAVFLVSQRQEARVGAELSATALVYLWPQNFELPAGQTVTIDVKIDTKGQTARRAEATISFDPQFVTVGNINAGDGVNLAQKALNADDGILQLSGVGEFENEGTLATFEITGVGQGATELKITNAHIWDPSGQVDIFGNAIGAEVTIK